MGLNLICWEQVLLVNNLAPDTTWALPEWLSWLEYCPLHQKVVGSISGQGTYLGCRCTGGNQCFSPFLSLKINNNSFFKNILREDFF